MSDLITATPTKAKFQQGVSWLRKNSFTFDATRKVWTRKPGNWEEWITDVAATYGCTVAQYLSRSGVTLVERES